MQSHLENPVIVPSSRLFRDIKMFNSASNRIESIAFHYPERPTIYTCGLTVYDHPHLGHLRIMITMDILVRLLELQGREVVNIRNTTDIDDKIIQRAIREHTTVSDVVSTYTQSMLDIEQRLHLRSLTARPRATEHMQEMYYLIQQLLDQDHAYVTHSGNVWLRQQAVDHTFGRLSGKRLDSLGNSRLRDTLDKENPGDVALWKSSDDSPYWDSPWGQGRPGWHIECSAMIHKHVGSYLDIHAGGMDLQFPHHEVEWAQSYHATGKDLAAHWMHIGFVQIGDNKMGKSLGNALWAHEYLDQYGANALRWWVLSGHYRQPLNAQEATLKLAHQTWLKIGPRLLEAEAKYNAADIDYLSSFLENDLQTPLFLKAIFNMADKSPASVRYMLETLGFVWPDYRLPDALLSDELLRQQYKRAARYADADAIRNSWVKQGWSLQERQNHVVWWHYLW